MHGSHTNGIWPHSKITRKIDALFFQISCKFEFVKPNKCYLLQKNKMLTRNKEKTTPVNVHRNLNYKRIFFVAIYHYKSLHMHIYIHSFYAVFTNVHANKQSISLNWYSLQTIYWYSRALIALSLPLSLIHIFCKRYPRLDADRQLVISYKDAREFGNCFRIFVVRIHWCGRSNFGVHGQPFLLTMPVILCDRV